MGWIKDNLIAVLGCLSLALGIGWMTTHLWHAAKEAKLETQLIVAQTDAKNAMDANATNQTVITGLQNTNTALIAAAKAEKEAAAKAAARVEELKVELGAQIAKNAALRQKLAQENPDVAAYLADGMPCELARQLWGDKAGYCQN